jgi:uncharacterized protein with HEPN domain
MIEEFTHGLTFEEFRDDPKTVAAVERKFLVIGEAATRLGSEAVLIAADIPWREIRDLGNLLRHAYDRVDLEIIWSTVTDDLPALKHALLRALESG